MIFREILLPEAVRGAAFCGWEFVMEPGDPSPIQHTIPPDGTTNLVLVRSPDGGFHPSLVGPSVASDEVPVMQGWLYCGLRLRPDAARRVIGKQPATGTRQVLARGGWLEPIWRDLEACLGDGTDWAGTISVLAGATGGDDAVAAAVDLLVASGGSVPIPALSRAAGLSERQFRRRFQAATGLAPKAYADVQRVRRALILSLDDPDWAGIAEEAGFADQPHLIRDIRERFGAPPRQVRGYIGGIRHELLTFGDVRFVQDRPAEAA